MTPLRVALLRFNRGDVGGEERRVATWRAVLDQPGILSIDLDVRGHTRPCRHAVMASLLGRAVPESMTWCSRSVVGRLAASGVDVVVSVTARAFHPDIAARWPLVLDLVDPLEVSYRQRASLSKATRRALWKVLAWSHARFAPQHVQAVVAAGYGDAARLGLEWLPNVVSDVRDAPGWSPTPSAHDIVFFGSLSYLPNVAGVVTMERMLANARDLRVLVAGRSPSDVVRAVVARNGWTLEEDYESVGALATRARVAVAPLTNTAGIQNKVLEAAAAGLPQVVTPQAIAGLAPGFPARVCAADDEFVQAVRDLVADRVAARALAADARRHVLDTYGVDRWRAAARALLRDAIDHQP